MDYETRAPPALISYFPIDQKNCSCSCCPRTILLPLQSKCVYPFFLLSVYLSSNFKYLWALMRHKVKWTKQITQFLQLILSLFKISDHLQYWAQAFSQNGSWHRLRSTLSWRIGCVRILCAVLAQLYHKKHEGYVGKYMEKNQSTGTISDKARKKLAEKVYGECKPEVRCRKKRLNGIWLRAERVILNKLQDVLLSQVICVIKFLPHLQHWLTIWGISPIDREFEHPAEQKHYVHT